MIDSATPFEAPRPVVYRRELRSATAAAAYGRPLQARSATSFQTPASNADLLSNIGFATTENEPAKNWQNLQVVINWSSFDLSRVWAFENIQNMKMND